MKLSNGELNKTYEIIKINKYDLSKYGINVGVKVKIEKKAPLGGPLLLKVLDYYLSIRKEVADFIWVK